MSPITGTTPQPSKCLSMTLAFQMPSSKTPTPTNSVGTPNMVIKPHWSPHSPLTRNQSSISEWTLVRLVFHQTPPSSTRTSNFSANPTRAPPSCRCMKWNQTSGLKMNSRGTEAQMGMVTIGKMGVVLSPRVPLQPPSTLRKPLQGLSLALLPASNRGLTPPRMILPITSLSDAVNTGITRAQAPSPQSSILRKQQWKQTNHL